MEGMIEIFREPIVSFAVLLAVILIVPLAFERIRLPGLVGLLLAGVILGPNGLRLLENESETMTLLSDIGLIYLMFVAGLEVDINQFRKTKFRSAGFGSLTFIVPLIMGTIVGRAFGFDWNASILIGSLFASHTLLAYPILSRMGVVNNEAVTVTIGATIFTDIGALLVLAICIGVAAGDFTIVKLITLLVSLAIYSAVILFGFDWAGREFFRRSGDEQGNQFLFVLLVVFLASLGAELIGVEKIVGAFLAGLAVNDAIGDGPVKEKIIFVGSVLFIPIFFVDMGLLVDLPAFVKSIGSIGLTLAVVTGLIGSKFLAAFFAKLLYRYNWTEMLTMWSLSLPQVAATLAATLVGYRAGVLTEEVLNSVLVLMLVTSTLGPLITARAASSLVVKSDDYEPEADLLDWSVADGYHDFSVIVPVYNPQTEQNLLEMAALLAQQESGRVVPLAITVGHAHMDAPQLDASIQRSQKLLSRAKELSQNYEVEIDPLLRIDDSIAQGISRASREQNANLVIMGWGQRTGLRAKLFGNVIDDVLWAAHCPVAIARLLDSPKHARTILVPVENLTIRAMKAVSFAYALAAANQAELTVLHVCDRRTSASRRTWIVSQLTMLVNKLIPESETDANPAIKIEVIPAEDVVQTILRRSEGFDLVMMRSQRRRNSAGGLMISDLTTQIVKQLNCSVVMLGEPYRVQEQLYRSGKPISRPKRPATLKQAGDKDILT